MKITSLLMLLIIVGSFCEPTYAAKSKKATKYHIIPLSKQTKLKLLKKEWDAVGGFKNGSQYVMIQPKKKRYIRGALTWRIESNRTGINDLEKMQKTNCILMDKRNGERTKFVKSKQKNYCIVTSIVNDLEITQFVFSERVRKNNPAVLKNYVLTFQFPKAAAKKSLATIFNMLKKTGWTK